MITKSVSWVADYKFGEDGSVWSRRPRNGKGPASSGWRLCKGFVHKGYKYIAIYIDGRTRKYSVARLVCEAFHGPCPEGLECCHYDGNPLNNSSTNLRWDTHTHNALDMDRHGRVYRADTHYSKLKPELIPRGEDAVHAKLTNLQAEEIRAKYQRGKVGYIRLAKMYGVSSWSIRDVVHRRTFKESFHTGLR